MRVDRQPILSSCLYKLYSINNQHWRKMIIKTVTSTEGGEFFSKTLRRIFSRYHEIEIGMYSYGGCFSIENMPPGTSFGRYCSVARRISILSGNHPIKFRSLHPFFYNPSLGYVDELLINRTKLTVENDVWIGQHVIILPSVSKIENGAVIGAGSVVTKNVPPFTVVVGNPAKVIKYRFSKDIINQIIISEWWKQSIDTLRENKLEFQNFLRPLD